MLLTVALCFQANAGGGFSLLSAQKRLSKLVAREAWHSLMPKVKGLTCVGTHVQRLVNGGRRLPACHRALTSAALPHAKPAESANRKRLGSPAGLGLGFACRPGLELLGSREGGLVLVEGSHVLLQRQMGFRWIPV